MPLLNYICSSICKPLKFLLIISLSSIFICQCIAQSFKNVNPTKASVFFDAKQYNNAKSNVQIATKLVNDNSKPLHLRFNAQLAICKLNIHLCNANETKQQLATLISMANGDSDLLIIALCLQSEYLFIDKQIQLSFADDALIQQLHLNVAVPYAIMEYYNYEANKKYKIADSSIFFIEFCISGGKKRIK